MPTDSERLDFVEQNRASISSVWTALRRPLTDGTMRYETYYRFDGYSFGESESFPTIREAIDAAMKEKQNDIC